MVLKENVNYRSGSFATNDVSVSSSYKKEKFGISAFINRYSSSGYDLDASNNLNTVDPFTNYTFETKLTYEISDKTELLLSGRYYTQNQESIPTETLRGESNINEWNVRFKLATKHAF